MHQAQPKLPIEAVVRKVVRWLFVIVDALLGVVIIVSLMERKRFTAEFKREAVRPAKQPGSSRARVAPLRARRV